MNANDFVFVGLKNCVTAIGKSDGQILWSTNLPGGLGTSSFVTVSCDDRRVFACANGQIHCLDLFSGQVLWTNGLAGMGYGIASLCVPGGPRDTTAAASAHISAQESASSAACA